MELRNDPGVVQFVKCANDYVVLVERIVNGDNVAISVVSKTLAILYAAAFDLPNPELADKDVLPDTFNMTTDDFFGIFNGVINWFHPKLDSIKLEPAELEAITSKYVDADLAEVYSHLKSGLRAWETGNKAFEPEIVFEWKFSFETHWGCHAVNALRVMHDLAWKVK